DLAGNLLDQNRDGNRGAADDFYEFTVNLTPIDLAIQNIQVNTNKLWVNDPVIVAWEGLNRAGAPLLGEWFDGIYLSADPQWDIHDVRVGTVRHTGGLSAGETYSSSATIIVPGTLP